MQKLAVSLVTVGQLAAINPSLPIKQYVHTAWTEADGAGLPVVNGLAQGADGYLWMATARGLFRFDGIKFVRWTPPPGESLPDEGVRHVLSSREGLWISSRSALSRMKNGKLYHYRALNQALRGNIIAMVEGRDGMLWLVAARHEESGDTSALAAVPTDGPVRIFTTADGLPATRIEGILQAQGDASFWLATPTGMCRWSPGSEAACRPAVPEAAASLSGRRMFSIRQFVEQVPDRWKDLTSSPGALLRDRSGNLWAATGRGLARFKEGKVDLLTRRDGLSGNTIPALLEDSEGDLWVATDGGVDRFQDPRVLHFSTTDGLSGNLTNAILAARDGAVWVATAGTGVDRIRAGKVANFAHKRFVTALYEDVAGGLWVATDGGVGRLVHGDFVEVTTHDGRSLRRVAAITGDKTGAVWLADQDAGLFRVQKDLAERLPVPAIPALFRVTAATDGALWLGSYSSGITTIGKTAVSQFPPRSGPVHVIYEDDGGQIWVGVGPALGRFRNGKWTMWTTNEGLPDASIFGIVQDNGGSLWVLSATALVRLSISELNSVPDGASQPLHLMSVGAADGLRLAPTGMPSPRMVKAADGRIWVCGFNGVAILDPASLRMNAIPPPVAIEQMSLNGKPEAVGGPGPVSFRSGELHLAYNAVSLMAPERLRFRYRLEPNGHWTDAGTRRDVTYVGLQPGRYRFHVAAANLDGVWNETGAAIAFRVEPSFFQTIWFALLCGSGAMLIVMALHRLRVRRLTLRFHLVAQERARITREIHDSLLQGFAGVIFQMDAARRQFDTAPEQSKRRLETALDRADHAMREARQFLSTMRLPALEEKTLPDALRETGAILTENRPFAFQLRVKGRVEPLAYETQANLYLIGREAIVNAMKHSGGARVVAHLVYTERALRLIVQDDGAGFNIGEAKEEAGHWGLRAMRERAQRVGASFVLETELGCGTRIEVNVRRK